MDKKCNFVEHRTTKGEQYLMKNRFFYFSPLVPTINIKKVCIELFLYNDNNNNTIIVY